MGKHSRSGFWIAGGGGKNVRGGVAEKPTRLHFPHFWRDILFFIPFQPCRWLTPLYFLPPTLGFLKLAKVREKKGKIPPFAYFPAQIYKNACGSLKLLRFRFSLSFSAISPDLFLCQTACFPRTECGRSVGVLTCKNIGKHFSASMYLNRRCADLKIKIVSNTTMLLRLENFDSSAKLRIRFHSFLFLFPSPNLFSFKVSVKAFPMMTSAKKRRREKRGKIRHRKK